MGITKKVEAPGKKTALARANDRSKPRAISPHAAPEEEGESGMLSAHEAPQYERTFAEAEAFVAEGNKDDGQASVWLDIVGQAWDEARFSGDYARLAKRYAALLAALKRQVITPAAPNSEGLLLGGLRLADLKGTNNLPSFDGSFNKFADFWKSFVIEVD